MDRRQESVIDPLSFNQCHFGCSIVVATKHQTLYFVSGFFYDSHLRLFVGAIMRLQRWDFVGVTVCTVILHNVIPVVVGEG